MEKDDFLEYVIEDTKERMVKAIDHVKTEFAAVRTGRASSSLVEGIMVDYYGSETPLKQLANFWSFFFLIFIKFKTQM